MQASDAANLPVDVPTQSLVRNCCSMDLTLAHCEGQRAVDSGLLFELKPGGPRSLFLVHDGYGDATIYSKLALRMPEDLAVIGILPRSLAGVPLAHTSIESMASFYVSELRKKQPHGPYLLGGLCAGGVIAYEMASQLSRDGDRIELLVVLEAAVPQTPKRLSVVGQRIGRMNRALADAYKGERTLIAKARSVVGTILGKIFHTAVWEITQLGQKCSVHVRFHLMSQVLARQLTWPKWIPQLSVLQIYEIADARYVPKPLYAVPIVLVRALRRSFILSDTPYRYIYADETLGWHAMTRGLVVIDADGGHSTMLEGPFVGPLAEALLPYLAPKSGSPILGKAESHCH
jgi:thioesterase domain-containing protein